jgi:DNA mismatch repair protein MutS
VKLQPISLLKPKMKARVSSLHIDRNASISQQYQTVYDHYIQILGKRLFVIMQVGSMYEMYASFDPQNETQHSTNMSDTAKMLGFAITDKGRVPKSDLRFVNMGFPVYSVVKSCNIFVQEGYTIVIVDQEDFTDVGDDLPGKGKQRYVKEIISPGISMHRSDHHAVHTVSLYIENQSPNEHHPRLEKFTLMIGLTALDVATNQCTIFETSTLEKLTTKLNALEEIYRFLRSVTCRELIINFSNFPCTDEQQLDLKKQLCDALELKEFFVNSFEFNKVPKEVTTQLYQNNAWKNLDTDHRVQIADLMRYRQAAGVAYLLLLQYVAKRNTDAVLKLGLPRLWSSAQSLILTHNAIQQLDICPTLAIDYKTKDKRLTLYDIVNNASTPAGKRELEALVIKPHFDPVLLNKQYDEIEHLMGLGSEVLDFINKQLLGMVDFEKKHRLLELRKLAPHSLAKLIDGYDRLLVLHDYLVALPDGKQNVPLPSAINIDNFREYVQALHNIFVYEKLEENRSAKLLTVNVIARSINDELDCKDKDASGVAGGVYSIARSLAEILEPNCDLERSQKLVRIVTNKDRSYFEIDNKYKAVLEFYKKAIASNALTKYNTVDDLVTLNRDAIDDVDLLKCGRRGGMPPDKVLSTEEIKLINSLTFARMKSKSKVYTKYITIIESDGESYLHDFRVMLTRVYHDLLCQAYTAYQVDIAAVMNWMVDIDLLKSKVITAVKQSYGKPHAVVQQDDKPSFIRATNTRNPIIECIDQEIKYVRNDITLGADVGPNGLFLAGINSAGKTSYIKSVALCLIMAQCGMYVPADSFEFNPFRNIITRLSGVDNMYKRQGSFAVEMSELTTIVDQSTCKTLVLGDEICRGTENQSALAIVAATTIKLCRNKTNFVFATHLRGLDEFPEVKVYLEQKVLAFKHLTVRNNFDNLVFEYKLRDGIGENLYGIEVAQMMGLDREVCDLAYAFRFRLEHHDYTGQSIIPLWGSKKSRYNSKFILGWCQVPGCKEKAEDTHHIVPQSEADEQGYVATEKIHKNDLHNLTGLCAKHHQDHHNGLISIKGYVSTPKGIVLDVK